jgi:ubiquinone/menaquinone biosynthesis C-methylase UbiE
MHRSEYKTINQLEEKHFFYVGVHFLVVKLLEKYTTKPGNILDAGCGTGGLLTKLKKNSEASGIDLSDEAIKFCKAKGLNAIKGSVDDIPHKDNTFDAATSIDVIYHQWVKDDVKALAEIHRVLKPKGVLVIRVPANNWLRTAHDQQVMTGRRYSQKSLTNALHKAGFEVKYISYLHLPILPLSMIKALLDKVLPHKPKSGVEETNKVINDMLTSFLKLEARILLTGVRLPFGNGLIAVGVKEADK